jgi:hypothetical protein
MKAGIRLTPVHRSASLREVLFCAILPIARVIDQARAEGHLPIPDRLIPDSDVLCRHQRSGDQRKMIELPKTAALCMAACSFSTR